MVFHEIYGSYFQVVAAILREAVRGGITQARLREIVREKAFLESGITIPAALSDGSWPLLSADGRTPLAHEPSMPLTTLEKRWMKTILQDPRVRLFCPPEEAPECDPDEPLFDMGFFVWSDRYADGDPFEDPAYIEHFRLILLGLREGRLLHIRYRGRGRELDRRFIPDRLEYSSKDDKFRLLAHSQHGTPYVINLARVLHVGFEEPADAAGEGDGSAAPARRGGTASTGPARNLRTTSAHGPKDEVVLELRDERNALERAMIHFSDLEKETVRLDRNLYRIRLRYRRDDETEILIRILSFGPMVRVTAPESFISLIRERIGRQMRLKSQA